MKVFLTTDNTDFASLFAGTTLNMLSFPLNKPNDFKIKLRMKRLYEYRKWVWEQAKNAHEELDWDNVELKGQVGQTFEGEYKAAHAAADHKAGPNMPKTD